jgi:putative inorganic carbon (HCO3(-)) transporter
VQIAATQDLVVSGSTDSARRWQASTLAKVGFWAVALFTTQLYLSLAQWQPWLEPLHLPLVLSLIGLVSIFLHRVLTQKPLWMGWRTALLAVYAATAVLSPMWAIDRPTTVTGALEVAKHFIFFVSVLNTANTPGRIRTSLFLYCAAAIIPAWGTWWNYSHDLLLVEGFRGRWLGVLADPNHDCMALVAVVPVLLFFAIGKNQHWFKRLVGAVGVVVCLMGIIATHSRGGSLGLATSVVVFALMSRRKAIASIVVLVAAAGVLVLAPQSFWTRNETIAGYAEDASVQGRINAWHVAFRIARERPFFGVGEAGFLSAWKQYAAIDAPLDHPYVAHNLFLEVVGELGFVGLFGMVGLLLCSLWSGWRARNGELGGESRALFAALIGYLVCQLFSGYSLSWFLYAICAFAACCDIYGKKSAEQQAALPLEGSELPALGLVG